MCVMISVVPGSWLNGLPVECRACSKLEVSDITGWLLNYVWFYFPLIFTKFKICMILFFGHLDVDFWSYHHISLVCSREISNLFSDLTNTKVFFFLTDSVFQTLRKYDLVLRTIDSYQAWWPWPCFKVTGVSETNDSLFLILDQCSLNVVWLLPT